jgi:hypothetical protein
MGIEVAAWGGAHLQLGKAVLRVLDLTNPSKPVETAALPQPYVFLGSFNDGGYVVADPGLTTCPQRSRLRSGPVWRPCRWRWSASVGCCNRSR